MAAKCYCCDNAIMNNEFISCAGVCNEIFHIKCVAVSKATLNAVNNCSNVHWYCHNCNDSNRHISASLKHIDESIARLSTSLSSDLVTFLDGLRELMDNIIGKVVTMASVPRNSHSIVQQNETSQPSGSYNVTVPESQDNVVDSKKITKSRAGRDSTKSIVVSNIGMDVSIDCLESYLSSKLGIEKAKIHLSLLLPIGKSANDMYFLQYKVTIPDDYYGSIMCSALWPKDVRLRDFIYKEKKYAGVSKERFLY